MNENTIKTVSSNYKVELHPKLNVYKHWLNYVINGWQVPGTSKKGNEILQFYILVVIKEASYYGWPLY